MATNEKHYCVCLTEGDLNEADRAALSRRRAAVLNNARWPLASQITIRFLGGNGTLQERVRNVATEWTKVANLSFQFQNNGSTDVRIAFVPGGGSWSYLGTMCRSIPEPKPTMNYGWLTDDSEDAEVRRVVLHEFGHAIGLIHEHQNPQGGIPWNKPAVIHDLSGPPNNWDEATIENNMFRYYAPGDVTGTQVDPLSIMMYPIPAAWTLNGFSAGLNGELSENDGTLIKNVYPR
jgi:hypothetical protein